MENSVLILWIPILLISIASILKIISQKTSNGKPWIRIEKVEEDE